MTKAIVRTLETIENEFKDKAIVYKQMVGTLYPSIIFNELMQLQKEYESLGGNVRNLPNVSCPNTDGRASPF